MRFREEESPARMVLPSLPLASQLDPWLAALPARYRQPGIIRRFTRTVEAFLRWYEGTTEQPLTLDGFTPALLVDYRTYLQDHQGIPPVSLNSTLEALRSWYAWLTKASALDRLPQPRPGGAKTRWRREALTPAQVMALLEHAQTTGEGVRNVAILQLLVQTGMRVGECSRLTWADVVPGEPQGWLIVRQKSSACSRQLSLPPAAQQSLLAYFATRQGCAPTLAAVAAHWPPPGTAESLASVWRSRKGGALAKEAIDQMVLLVLRMAAARGHFPPHPNAATLRRTFARTYLDQHPDDYQGLATVLDEPVATLRSAFCHPGAEARSRTQKGTPIAEGGEG